MIKIVTTLFNGTAGLKNYDVRKCIADNDKMEVIHNGEKMTLSCEELDSKHVSTSPLFKSKIPGGKDYKLLGYVWNPDIMEL